MIVFKENVDEEKFMEIILMEREVKDLERYGSVYSKEQIDGEIINLAIRIDNFEQNS